MVFGPSHHTRTRGSLPMTPKTKYFYKGSHQHSFQATFAGYFWRRLVNPEFMRPSIWVSDFRHRYLMMTGRDYVGPIPATPAAGMYAGFDKRTISLKLGKNHNLKEESRKLPVMPMNPRVVLEFRREVKQDYYHRVRSDKRKINELKETEFFEWYTKLQRVRGKWCRENEIRSRGIYGPAVDAAELWG